MFDVQIELCSNASIVTLLDPQLPPLVVRTENLLKLKFNWWIVFLTMYIWGYWIFTSTPNRCHMEAVIRTVPSLQTGHMIKTWLELYCVVLDVLPVHVLVFQRNFDFLYRPKIMDFFLSATRCEHKHLFWFSLHVPVINMTFVQWLLVTGTSSMWPCIEMCKWEGEKWLNGWSTSRNLNSLQSAVQGSCMKK